MEFSKPLKLEVSTNKKKDWNRTKHYLLQQFPRNYAKLIKMEGEGIKDDLYYLGEKKLTLDDYREIRSLARN